uniref:Putative conserved oligomeric Golgi complex subunit 4 n=1 Tax=Davidia involucrata TaxID=16924 RepID=A0A5B7C9Z6_DAVIN
MFLPRSALRAFSATIFLLMPCQSSTYTAICVISSKSNPNSLLFILLHFPVTNATSSPSHAIKKQIEGIVRRRLFAVVDWQDHPTMLRFIRLYSPLSLEEEGLQVYVSYLKKVIAISGGLNLSNWWN